MRNICNREWERSRICKEDGEVKEARSDSCGKSGLREKKSPIAIPLLIARVKKIS